MSLERQQELEERYVMHTFGRKPVEFVRGSRHGARGRQGPRVPGLHRRHRRRQPGALPSGRRPMRCRQQAEKLIHVSNYYYIEGRGEVARRLSDLLNHGAPEGAEPWQSFFANSGAEANECAIKLARLHARKRAEAQALADGAGRTRPAPQRPPRRASSSRSTAASTGAPWPRWPPRPSPPSRRRSSRCPTASPIRRPTTWPRSRPCSPSAATRYAPSWWNACRARAACIRARRSSCRRARRLTEERGALLMCDEVQTGVFRCGTPFAFQRFGIVPDVVTIAKGVASGMPAGMCAARANVAASFAPGDHGSTFGGSNLAVAAAAGHVAHACGRGLRRARRARGRLPARAPGRIASRGGGARAGAHGGCRPGRGRRCERRRPARAGRGPRHQRHRPAYAALPASARLRGAARGPARRAPVPPAGRIGRARRSARPGCACWLPASCASRPHSAVPPASNDRFTEFFVLLEIPTSQTQCHEVLFTA